MLPSSGKPQKIVFKHYCLISFLTTEFIKKKKRRKVNKNFFFASDVNFFNSVNCNNMYH